LTVFGLPPERRTNVVAPGNGFMTVIVLMQRFLKLDKLDGLAKQANHGPI
jgi:hypothetical protein